MTGAAIGKDGVPLDMWGFDGPVAESHPNLPVLLRALADETRLDILRLLAAGQAEADVLSKELQLPKPVVRRHLRALVGIGMVRTDARTENEVYQLAQHAIRLLNATFTYGLDSGPPPFATEKRVHRRVPLPPLACTVCDNRDFVSQTLVDLNGALSDARQYHGRIKEMSSQVLTAHEAERKRIARELHDDTAQALTSILVRLHLLERSTESAEVLQNVEELRELTSGALDSVRRMAMDLRPAALDDLGLVPALQAYAEKYSRSWPTSVTVNVDGLLRRLPPGVEVVLYRVVQEALANVAKHASASSAIVSLSRRHNEVTLVVEDNGTGFDPPDGTQKNGPGLGLFGMRERLALVSGEVQVQSARGKGTRITARVPLANRRAKIRRTS